MREKIGIIYKMNVLNSNSQAVLLKVFEELPEFSKVFFTGTYIANFTIKTRSEIHYLSAHKNDPHLESAKKKIKEAIKANSASTELFFGWRILARTIDLFEEGFLSESEKMLILKNLGLNEEI